jgi:hypothetical protein
MKGMVLTWVHCVIDTIPRVFLTDKMLKLLATQVIKLLQLRRKTQQQLIPKRIDNF